VKSDLKILGIISALFVVMMIISAASAADSLNNGNFGISVPAGSNFTKEATTNFSFGDVGMDMLVFENLGTNFNNVSTIMFLNDSTPDKSVISSLYGDLKEEGKIVEQSGNYTVFKTQNSDDLLNSDDDLGNVSDLVGGIFSSVSDINVSSENNTVSLSDDGLNVSDANGGNVSISPEGVSVSTNSSDGKNSTNVNVLFEDDVALNVRYGDYTIYIKNPNSTQVIIISGNDLDALKQMAKTASF
jgi:hypothetical protein